MVAVVMCANVSGGGCRECECMEVKLCDSFEVAPGDGSRDQKLEHEAKDQPGGE